MVEERPYNLRVILECESVKLCYLLKRVFIFNVAIIPKCAMVVT
jgi:hypothetical protein